MALILLFPTILVVLLMLALLGMAMNACSLVVRERLSSMALRRSDRRRSKGQDER
jgi:hypothetical protein